MKLASRCEITGPELTDSDRILTPAALQFVAELDNRFAERREEILAARRHRAELAARGWTPDFDPDTASIRSDHSWYVAAAAPGLVDRRVEITGPPERRMAVNALNSGARVWMADFEDATSPTWSNIISGQANLLDACTSGLDFTQADGRRYRVGADPATVIVRPRGWHLVDKHLLVDGRPVSASILDFGLYLYHCGQPQISGGRGPYFYLPKLEDRQEARLWNEVFLSAQELLGLDRGTIRATVLIETIYAAFHMEEILYELREHSAGLNAGRWDYLFSIIKAFGDRSDFVLPDRSAVTMNTPFMRAYCELLVSTCHRRGAHAIGGMAAQIPSPDPAVNSAALRLIRSDKEREAEQGFDGSWVAHPGLVATCREVFDSCLGRSPNQIATRRPEAAVTATDLLAVSKTPGAVSLTGVSTNVEVMLRYVACWLGGQGAVAVNGLMEDVATAEIARCQLWQWIRHRTPLADGGVVDRDLVAQLAADHAAAMANEAAVRGQVAGALAVFEAVTLAEELPQFLTNWAYCRYLVTH
jgi:malate synthase